jgi:hypothetical protein
MATSKESTGWKAEILTSAVVPIPAALVAMISPETVAGRIPISGIMGMFPITVPTGTWRVTVGLKVYRKVLPDTTTS